MSIRARGEVSAEEGVEGGEGAIDNKDRASRHTTHTHLRGLELAHSAGGRLNPEPPPVSQHLLDLGPCHPLCELREVLHFGGWRA